MKLFRKLKCFFGAHEIVWEFRLHDYVNSALAEKKFRYSVWAECKKCGFVPKVAPSVPVWDDLTPAEKAAKIAAIQNRTNTAPGRNSR